MKLTIDLTGSQSLRDELDLLRDAQQAVRDLLLPDCDLDRDARGRLCILLLILDALMDAALQSEP